MKTDKNTAAGLEKRSWWGNDIHLNVGPREAIVRLILGLIVGGFVFFSDNMVVVIITIIISFYLIITGFSLFCFAKYLWRHKILHKEDPETEDPEVPVHKL